jgi:hypothetical protein
VSSTETSRLSTRLVHIGFSFVGARSHYEGRELHGSVSRRNGEDQMLEHLGALGRGGVLGGVAVLLISGAIAIKTCGPELRCWTTMIWHRQDTKKARESAP